MVIIKPLKSQIINKTTLLILTVEYKKPKSMTVEWYHNGRKFTGSPDVETTTTETTSTLKFRKFDAKLCTGKWEVRVGEHTRSSCSVRATDDGKF